MSSRTELTPSPEVVLYSVPARIELGEMTSRTSDQGCNTPNRRKETTSTMNENRAPGCVLGTVDSSMALLTKKETSTPVEIETSCLNNSFETTTRTSYPATSSETAGKTVLTDINSFRVCLAWLLEKYNERLNQRIMMVTLLTATREAATNLKKNLRSDAGDSGLKHARDPESHGYLVAKKDFLEQMMVTLTSKAEVMCADHSAIRVIQNKAWRHIRAARRGQASHERVAEEEATPLRMQGDSAEK